MIPKEVMYGIIIITLMIFMQAVESGKVTRHLRSKVALENTTTTFTCSGTGENAHVNIDSVNAGIDNKEIRWIVLPEYIPEHHINVTGSGNSSSEHSFIIGILAEISNNETEIRCTFVGDYTSKTGPAVLYVAKDKLGEVKEFQEPKLSCNKASITISWSPPWSHLINNYTVTVTNMSSDVQTVNHVHNNETIWTMYRTHNHATQCHKLELFVTAFTDVGEATSKVIETGFPIELGVLYDEDVTVEVFPKQNGKIRAEIRFEAPNHCSLVQVILYNYTIFKDGESNNSEHYGPISAGPGLDSEDFIEREGNYTLEITYWDGKSSVDEVTITKHFRFSLSTQSDISFDVTPTVSSFDLLNSPTITTTHNILPIIIGLVLGGTVILTTSTVIMIVVLYFFFKSRQVKRITEQSRSGTDRIDFTLPNMITNDNYANPQEATYETIQILKNLKQVKERGDCSSPSPTTPGCDAPLLPPRNTLSLPPFKSQNLEPMTLKEDEYIEMTGHKIPSSPRYIEAPTICSPLSYEEVQETSTTHFHPGTSGIHKVS